MVVKIFCRSLLQETFVIQDLYYYDPLTSDSGHWTPFTVTGATRTFSSNGMTITGNTLSHDSIQSRLNITYPTSYSVEYEVTALDRTFDGYITELAVEGVGLNSNQSNKYIFQLDRWVETVTEFNGALNVGDVVKFEYSDNSVKVYVNDVLITSKSKHMSYTGFIINQYQRRSITIKNLKVKAL